MAGSDRYQLGEPLFDKAEIKLVDKPLIIDAENFSTNHPYVSQIWLNGVQFDRTWLTQADIAPGGSLRFVMAAGPAKR